MQNEIFTIRKLDTSLFVTCNFIGSITKGIPGYNLGKYIYIHRQIFI